MKKILKKKRLSLKELLARCKKMECGKPSRDCHRKIMRMFRKMQAA